MWVIQERGGRSAVCARPPTDRRRGHAHGACHGRATPDRTAVRTDRTDATPGHGCSPPLPLPRLDADLASRPLTSLSAGSSRAACIDYRPCTRCSDQRPSRSRRSRHTRERRRGRGSRVHTRSSIHTEVHNLCVKPHLLTQTLRSSHVHVWSVWRATVSVTVNGGHLDLTLQTLT